MGAPRPLLSLLPLCLQLTHARYLSKNFPGIHRGVVGSGEGMVNHLLLTSAGALVGKGCPLGMWREKVHQEMKGKSKGRSFCC